MKSEKCRSVTIVKKLFSIKIGVSEFSLQGHAKLTINHGTNCLKILKIKKLTVKICTSLVLVIYG